MQIDKNDIIIVIPTHKPTINSYERTSLEQLLKILPDYKIVFAIPDHIEFSPAQLIPGNKILEKVEVVRFKKEGFTSAKGYNKLLVTKDFFEPFRKYKFMFLYQMDAYVFYDALQEWASKGYDYIGAPWVKEDEMHLMKTMYRGKYSFVFSFMRFINRVFFGKKDYAIGNGGMSLRNIPKSLLVLDKLSSLANKWQTHEDIFWSMAVPMLYPFFKVPNMNEAFSFSFERDPEKFLELNNNQLPFGCHAWEKFSPEFWKKHIPIIN